VAWYRVTVRDGEIRHIEYAEPVRDHAAGVGLALWPVRLAVIRFGDDENAQQAAVDGATWYTISDVTERQMRPEAISGDPQAGPPAGTVRPFGSLATPATTDVA
jgi:hypothetical protein